jgi:uncharacterized protein (DUF58 family)
MRSRGSVMLFIGVILLVGLFVFAKVNGGFLSWFLLYVFILLFIYELASRRLTMRNLQISRHISANHLSASQSIDVELTVTKSRLWPMFWVEVSDCLPDKLSIRADGAKEAFIPLWNEQFKCSYQISDLPRGIHHLDEIRVESGDLFGLQRFIRVCSADQKLVVYPRIVPVRGWRTMFSEESGGKQSMTRRAEESSNVIGVRQYVPGDKLSRIHWPLSARTGQLQSKEFELHVTSDYMIISDASRDSFARSSGDELFDLEMTISASLMRHALDTNRRFGAVIHSSRLIRFEPGRGEALFLRCMETFALLQPACPLPFALSFKRLAGDLRQGCTLVIVSPDLSREMAFAISGIRKRGPVEWFIPGSSSNLTSEKIQLVQNLSANHVAVHFVEKPEQLSTLGRGGTAFANHS